MEGYVGLIYGFVLPCMAMLGYLGLCTAMYGYVSLCRAMYCYLGLCRAIISVLHASQSTFKEAQCLWGKFWPT